MRGNWVMFRRYKHLILFTIISLVYAFYHLSFYQDFYQTYKLNEQQKKELYFSEGAFYYSFYDQLINSESYIAGLKGLISNDGYEAPNTINPHKRFNITIEAIAATAFLMSKTMGLNIEPTRFYNNFMFIINSFSLLLIFLIIYLLTNSIWSFLLPLVLYLAHQDQVSRMILNTALRENIGIVFVLAHMYFFYYVLKSKSIYESLIENISPLKLINRFHILFVATTFLQLIFWQFTQFVLVIEIITLLSLYIFSHLNLKQLFDYFLLLIVSWFITVVYLMGSAFVLNSLFFFISLFFIISSGLLLSKNKSLQTTLKRFIYGLGVLVGAVLFHFAFNTLLGQQNDSHIFNFISAQFKDSTDFHAKLYLCDQAFNNISSAEISNFFDSGLLYLYLLTMLGLIILLIKPFFKESSINKKQSHRVYFYYLIIMSIGFSLIAYSGKRFLILALPLVLILITQSIYYASNYFNKLYKVKNIFTILIIVVSGFIFLKNKDVITHLFVGERPVTGSTLTELTDYINQNTSNATIAASMPISSSIKLLTDKKIHIHPQYENSELRERVKEVYKIYGNFKETKEIKKTKINFATKASLLPLILKSLLITGDLKF